MFKAGMIKTDYSRIYVIRFLGFMLSLYRIKINTYKKNKLTLHWVGW